MRMLSAAPADLRKPQGRQTGRTRRVHGRSITRAAMREESMASKNAKELRGRIDAAWENLSRQLQGMDAYMERSDAPGEWTTREVLSHLLFEPGFDPEETLSKFAERDYPLVEIAPGDTYLDDQRRQMTLA